MNNKQKKLLESITSVPETLGGKPTIRGTRFLVNDVLQLFSAGLTKKEILEQHPILQKEDIDAALFYASAVNRNEEVFVIPEHMKEGIRKGMEDIRNGDFITLEEFEKRYRNMLE